MLRSYPFSNSKSRIQHSKLCLSRLSVQTLFMLSFFFFTISPVSAKDNGKVSSLIHDVEAKAATVRTLTCTLKQERHLAIFSQPVVFQGYMALEKPDKLRWEFTSPIRSVFILNGSKALRCSGNTRPQCLDLNTNPLMHMVSKEIWNWVNGSYASLQKTYRIISRGQGPCILLKAINPNIARVISSIRITFYPDSLQPSTVKIQEPGGDFTVISFSDYIINRPIKQSLFAECSGP